MNLTWRQYNELSSLKLEFFDSSIDFQCEELAIALDVDSEDVKNLNSTEFAEKRTVLLKYLQSQPKAEESISINGMTLYKRPFNLLTLGEWIDLDYYIQHKDWLAIIVLIYRDKVDGELKADEWEEWGNYVEKRKALLIDTPFDHTRTSLHEILKWRTNFIESNGELFNRGVEEGDEPVEEDISVSEKHAQLLEERNNKFAWESLIMDLCQDDITKFNEVVSLPLLLVFNMLAMKKTLNK